MRAIWTGISVLALTAVSSPAFAVTAVPEPGILELAGLGFAVGLAAHWLKNRRK